MDIKVWVSKADGKIFAKWLDRMRKKFSTINSEDFIIFSIEIEFRKKFSKEKIVKLWREGGKTQAEIAKEVGCSKSYVQKVLESLFSRGKNSLSDAPTAPTMRPSPHPLGFISDDYILCPRFGNLISCDDENDKRCFIPEEDCNEENCEYYSAENLFSADDF